jgi:beta-carotene hydroxylase
MQKAITLDKEARSYAKHHMGEFAWPSVVYGIAVCSSYLATVGLTLAGMVPLGLSFALVTILTYLAYTLLHEAVHGSISGSRQSYRWVNETLGYMAAWILMIPLTAHRHEHLAHHRNTNVKERDPDFQVGELGNSALHAVRVPFAVFVEQFTYYTKHRLGKAPTRQSAYFFAEVCAAIMPRLALLASGFWLEGLTLFVLAWWFGLMIILYLFAYLVHRPHSEVGRYVDTSTFLAEGVLGRIVTTLWVCQNYHSIHHLFPRVPFYRYPALFRDIEEIMAAKGAPIVRLSLQGIASRRTLVNR